MTPTRPSPTRPAPFRRRSGVATGALLAALAAGPAAAEITAETVREEFETLYEGFGMTIEAGSEDAADGSVTLGDVVLSFEFVDEGSEPDEEFGGGAGSEEPEVDEEVRVEATFDEIAFEERSDGTVVVTLSPEGRMMVRTTDVETGEEDVVEMRLVAEGFEMTVAEIEAAAIVAEGAEGGSGAGGEAESGTGAEAEAEAEAGGGTDDAAGRRYDYAADRLGVVLVEALEAGEPVEGVGELTMTEVSGATELALPPGLAAGADAEAARAALAEWDAPLRLAQSAEVGELALRLDLPAGDSDAEPEEGMRGPERVEVSYLLSDLSLSGETTVPAEALQEMAEQGPADDDPAAVFEAGLAGEMALGYGPVAFAVTTSGAEDPSQAFTLEGGSRGGHFDLAVDGEAMSYSSGGRGGRFAFEGAGMPMPRVEVSLDEAETTFRLPVSESEEPRPFTVRYGFSGLTVSEEVWALFDPEGRLPRDPASLLVAAQGQIRLLASLFDEEAQAEAEEADEIPAEVESAEVELLLEAVGARVEADGDFTFDNADTTTFPGMPAPTGTLDVTATGIDALLDTLSEMGLVPPDQLMPARMMLGLFARSDGEGGYVSAIEVDGATGEVTANGQRLR